LQDGKCLLLSPAQQLWCISSAVLQAVPASHAYVPAATFNAAHAAATLPAGINCKGNMLYVQCCCGQRCKPAAGAANAAGSGSSSTCKLFGLEDWVEQHAGGLVIPPDDDAEAERLVRSSVVASSSGWGVQVSLEPAMLGNSRRH
jgi:hypothetical protein